MEALEMAIAGEKYLLEPAVGDLKTCEATEAQRSFSFTTASHV